MKVTGSSKQLDQTASIIQSVPLIN